MRGLIWNCGHIGWNSTQEEKSLSDSVLVFVCFETGDGGGEIKEAVRRIRQLNQKRFNKDKISVFPFAHLSKHILPEEEARGLMNHFFESLQKDFKEPHLIPFNIEKNVFIHLLPAKGDVSYFEY